MSESPFDRPVFIIGAPRSGTSLLQKVLRGHPDMWSLPSESEIVWDRYCHPRLRNWDSDVVPPEMATPAVASAVQKRFLQCVSPASTWQSLEKTGVIWGFRRAATIRKVLRPIYRNVFPVVSGLRRRPQRLRLVEKTVSNCFRIRFVDQCFPHAKYIYVIRDGRSSVSSLMSCWQDPTRFFSYRLPESLRIPGYDFPDWNFVLPPGWREYLARQLEDICAFQWSQCNLSAINELAREVYRDRVLCVQLEELNANPEPVIHRLAEFCELSFDDYFESLVRNLPVVNSPDGDTSSDKWKRKHVAEIERVRDVIISTTNVITASRQSGRIEQPQIPVPVDLEVLRK